MLAVLFARLIRRLLQLYGERSGAGTEDIASLVVVRRNAGGVWMVLRTWLLVLLLVECLKDDSVGASARWSEAKRAGRCSETLLPTNFIYHDSHNTDTIALCRIFRRIRSIFWLTTTLWRMAR
ncbi:hypothetical protein KCU93_g439, partial [Aureobasidium melanogenum]